MPKYWASREEFNEYHRRYYHKRRRAWIKLLGGKCATCGSKRRLQFDHREPKDKKINIGLLITRKPSPEAIAELMKCQLLCEPCHIGKTNAEKGPFKHGTIYAWMKKRCKCAICAPAQRRWYDQRNESRRASSPTGRGSEI